MLLKVFHTADIHIGMMFNRYPDNIKGYLRDARIKVIGNMVEIANENECDIFVIAGDLFDKTNGIDKKTISAVAKHLSMFTGSCVAIMPGNHDFENEMVDLWKTFTNIVDDKLLFLNEEKPYNLDTYGIEGTIYPAPCHSKHSKINNLSWIKEEEMDHNRFNIGVAHGSITGISPDMDNLYYNMDLSELNNIPVDIWLLGHTHIVYPEAETIKKWKVYNPGTPEPDGLDCKHSGNAWIVSIDEDKNISGSRTKTGKHIFVDKEFILSEIEDYNNIIDYFNQHSEDTIARIKVSGRVDEETYKYRHQVFKAIEDKIMYLMIEDNDLKIKINKDKINQEFTQGSFPEQFLLELQHDEEALQLAYEMILEVKNDN